MNASCAFDAHSSSEKWARYAHDLRRPFVHSLHMDTEWFKARKKELRLTDKTIAERVGRERSVINKVLNGTVQIEPANVSGWAVALEVSKTEILYRAGLSDEPVPEVAGSDLLLSVNLPNEQALTRMFETMLENDLPPSRVDELARSLAQQLPSALGRAATSPAVPRRDTSNSHDEAVRPGAKRRQPRRPESRT